VRLYYRTIDIVDIDIDIVIPDDCFYGYYNMYDWFEMVDYMVDYIVEDWYTKSPIDTENDNENDDRE